MHLYRCSDMFDEYNVYVCLTCKESFEATAPGKFCCNCGVMFDGVFTKRNPRWNTNKPYDWKNPGYKDDPKTGLMCQSDKPRVIVEGGQWVAEKLARDSFSVEPLLTPELRFRLLVHSEIGGIANRGDGTQCCCFVACYESFLRACKDKYYDVVRVRILSGRKSRLLKEHRRPTDFAKLIKDSKIDFSVMVSGVRETGCW